MPSQAPGGRRAELLLDAGDLLGEAAIWDHRAGLLYWLDLEQPTLRSYDPASGRATARPIAAPAPLGGLALSVVPGRLILVRRGGIALLDPASGDEQRLVDPLESLPGLNFNDVEVDRSGRLWAGTLDPSESQPVAVLLTIEVDGSHAVADRGFIVCNGPAFSPDGGTMYFSDTSRGSVLAYAVVDGRLEGRREFAQIPEQDGVPDGLATDAEGCVWIAHWGGSQVTRWTPGGQCIERVAVPTPNVTSIAFGGSDLGTLFITTAVHPFDDRSTGR